MGQRANLIIIEDGEYRLRYDHWVANRLDDVLFWGADYALSYFEAQEGVGTDGWLDDVWAEGGVALDLDKKHLLWWGGEDVFHEVLLRRVYLKLQKKVWRDWTIEWAHRGIVDLAEYVGYPKEKVLSGKEHLDAAGELKMPEKKNWLKTLGSVKTADGEAKLFPLPEEAEDYLRNGAKLIEQCRCEKGLSELNWAEWDEDEAFPGGGFLIDEKHNTVEFWQVGDYPNAVENLKNLWEDWDVIWHRDDYEFQCEKLGGKIILPETNEEKLTERLRKNLLREDGKSGVEILLNANEALRTEGRSVQINPWSFKSRRVVNPLETKQRIWREIFGESEKK
jgi:hypothetical protein